jgi:hypothetical protein
LFVSAALARHRFAKVRVTEGPIRHDKAKPLALRAGGKVHMHGTWALATGAQPEIIQG